MRKVWQSFRSHSKVFGQTPEVLLELQGTINQTDFSDFLSTQRLRLVCNRLRKIRQDREQAGGSLQAGRYSQAGCGDLYQERDSRQEGSCQESKVARLSRLGPASRKSRSDPYQKKKAVLHFAASPLNCFISGCSNLQHHLLPFPE